MLKLLKYDILGVIDYIEGMVKYMYREVFEGGTGEIVEKKSRFIATVFPISSEEEAISIIEQLKKKYWDARHNCYAYVCGNGSNMIMRFSDDGEPSQTAGKPMLDVIVGEKLRNTLVVVTRYFGGELLGTGGLVRAYQASTKEGLSNSVILQMDDNKIVRITSDYNDVGKIQYITATDNIPCVNSEYGEKAIQTYLVNSEGYEAFNKKITEATSGKSVIEVTAQGFYSTYNGQIIKSRSEG